MYEKRAGHRVFDYRIDKLWPRNAEGAVTMIAINRLYDLYLFYTKALVSNQD